MLNTVNSLNPDADTLEIPDILAVDKTGPKARSFTIKNIQHTYDSVTVSCVNWNLLSQSSNCNGFKRSKDE
jgi:hypothetical protein